MNAVDPKIELIPSDFKCSFADCFDLFFTGVGGARIHAKFVRPKDIQKPVPAVLQFHGYSGNAGYWSDLLIFAAEGFVVAALDCRGQGGLSEDVGGVKGTTFKGQIVRGLDDSPDKLLFRQIFLDTALLAKIVMGMEEVDPKRVGVTGGSQGGGLTLACAALVPEIKLAAPVFPFLSDYKRVWEMDLATGAYEEIKTFFRMFDPLHQREDEIFTKLGYIDIQNLAPRIKAKVMMGIGLMDTICPPSTQFAAYNKIKSEKHLKVYPDFGHENIPCHSDVIFEFMRELNSHSI
jgi:cephalosporin-C deacetylase